MRTLVTGAAGFVGRAVVARLAPRIKSGDTLVLTDVEIENPNCLGVTVIPGDLGEAKVRSAALEGADRVLHLVSAPGGASEQDYALSRRVNLETSLKLMDEFADAQPGGRFVYASSIAVFGSPLPSLVDDHTPPEPNLTYGAHKLMVETALANLARLRRLDPVVLRLSGLIARPDRADGLKSAFMSNIFHVLGQGQPFVSPIGPDATLWSMSVDRAARNLEHAFDIPRAPRAVTLPALRFTMEALAQAIADHAGVDANLVSYQPDPGLEADFGRWPPLTTPLADHLGFQHDGDLSSLVQAAFNGLRQ